MFKAESNREETKKNDNGYHAMQDVKVQEGTMEVKCVAGLCLTRAQAKKSDKILPLKVKEPMSSVNKFAIEDLQKKESSLKKCFDQVG